MSNELSVPANSQALSTQVFGHNARDDFKDMGEKDIILQRLRPAQASLEIVKDGRAAIGDWVLDGTGDIVFPAAQAGGDVIPIGWFKEWIEWNPDKTDKVKKILNRSSDPTTEVGKKLSRMAEGRVKIMTKKGEQYAVTEYYNFIVLIPAYTGNYSDFFLLSFSRTGHKIGKQWLNKLRNRKVDVTVAEGPDAGKTIKVDAPIYACQWRVDTKPEMNPEGEEYLVPVIGNGEQLPSEYWPGLREIADAFKARRAAFIEAGSEANAVEAEVESVSTAKDNPHF